MSEKISPRKLIYQYRVFGVLLLGIFSRIKMAENNVLGYFDALKLHP
jgi:hypothetical protein